jgi:hypothetical protein
MLSSIQLRVKSRWDQNGQKKFLFSEEPRRVKKTNKKECLFAMKTMDAFCPAGTSCVPHYTIFVNE